MDAAEKQHCFLSVTLIESVCVSLSLTHPRARARARTHTHTHTHTHKRFKRRGMAGNTPHA